MALEFNNEKEFQAYVVKDLKDNWYWVYKLPDIGYTLKPFDIIALKDWKATAIELKYGRVNTYERIYKMLRPNQVWWLLHFQEHWWIPLIIGWDKKENKSYTYIFKYQNYEWAL